jgi:N-acetylglucosaminyldiphosphoundecaprenol N-acetyl-beta-D-mannosaminyltransferase
MFAKKKLEIAMQVLPKKRAICVDISLGSFAEHIERFADFGAAHKSSYVCCVNVHMTVEAWKDERFKEVVNKADFSTADGMPVLNALNKFNRTGQERVAGNDIMPALMQEASKRGLSVYFYGGKQEVLDMIIERARSEMPDLRIAGAYSPPFRPLSDMEMQEVAQRINGTGAHVVMVSLGCPKQEKWMADMRGQVNAIMLGVGGAFLLYAGVDTRAPKWMRDMSLEWVYRLILEPRRLFKRYLITNTTYIYLYLKQLLVRR